MHMRIIYNGHKRDHGLKYQSISNPLGMIARLYGPVEGYTHDSTILALSDLSQELQLHSHDQCDNYLCIYGNPTYPFRRLL